MSGFHSGFVDLIEPHHDGGLIIMPRVQSGAWPHTMIVGVSPGSGLLCFGINHQYSPPSEFRAVPSSVTKSSCSRRRPRSTRCSSQPYCACSALHSTDCHNYVTESSSLLHLCAAAPYAAPALQYPPPSPPPLRHLQTTCSCSSRSPDFCQRGAVCPVPSPPPISHFRQ